MKHKLSKDVLPRLLNIMGNVILCKSLTRIFILHSSRRMLITYGLIETIMGVRWTRLSLFTTA